MKIQTKMMKISLIFFLLQNSILAEKPNIVIIVADDMGWNDVSFHGSNQIPTPNMDALAYNGVILNRHYVPPLCTPSRASLMTGKYPIRTGMHHFVIVSDEPWGLGLNEKIMPQFFRDAGYKTHLVGKWHLGLFEQEYTPTQRGFDEHIGYLGPYIDYWDHSLIMLDRNYSRGHDMRKNLIVDHQSNGTYATNHFSAASERIIERHDVKKPLFLIVNHLAPHTANEDDPMQAPEDEINKFSYIKNTKRRTLAAMISLLDKSVGKVVASLKKKDMLDNTIILFYSDNGAPTIGLHSNQGSNYPLKGQKNSPFEGGTRVPAFIWSPLIKNKQVVNHQWFHNTDWLPTLLEAAGIKVKGIDLDGVSQWKSLVNNLPGPRREVLVNIDEYFGYASYINDGWKLIDETLMPKRNNNVTLSGIVRGNGWIGEIDNDANLTNEEYISVVLNSEAGRIIAKDYPYKSPSSWSVASLWDNEPDDQTATILATREEATPGCYHSKTKVECDPFVAPCLFDIHSDPCEYNNLAVELPYKVQKMQWFLERHRKRMVPSRRQPLDPDSDPINFDYEWSWWRNSSSDARLRRSSDSESLYDLGLMEDILSTDNISAKDKFFEQTITLKTLIIAGGVVLLIFITFKMLSSYKSSKVKTFEIAK